MRGVSVVAHTLGDNPSTKPHSILLVVLGLSTGTAAQHGCAAVTVGVDLPTLERNRDSSPRGVTARVGKCGIQFG